MRQGSKESTGSSDSDSSSDDESTQTGATNVPTAGTLPPEKVNHQKESEAGAEISALVNYVQPVHFTSFEASESKFLHLNFCYNFIIFCENKLISYCSVDVSATLEKEFVFLHSICRNI